MISQAALGAKSRSSAKLSGGASIHQAVVSDRLLGWSQTQPDTSSGFLPSSAKEAGFLSRGCGNGRIPRLPYKCHLTQTALVSGQ